MQRWSLNSRCAQRALSNDVWRVVFNLCCARLSGRQHEPSDYAHIAISVGSEQRVDALTRRLRDDGFPIVAGPRRTGDGYYESVTLDPDGNRIEITA